MDNSAPTHPSSSQIDDSKFPKTVKPHYSRHIQPDGTVTYVWKNRVDIIDRIGWKAKWDDKKARIYFSKLADKSVRVWVLPTEQEGEESFPPIQSVAATAALAKSQKKAAVKKKSKSSSKAKKGGTAVGPSSQEHSGGHSEAGDENRNSSDEDDERDGEPSSSSAARDAVERAQAVMNEESYWASLLPVERQADHLGEEEGDPIDRLLALAADEPPAKALKNEPATQAAAAPAPAPASAPSGGSRPVDREAPDGGSFSIVDDWSVTLNVHDTDKYYIIQILKGKDKFWAYTRWFRGGERGQNKLEAFPTFEGAKASFLNKFKDKTGNQWADRASFKPRADRYVIVETEENDDRIDHHVALAPSGDPASQESQQAAVTESLFPEDPYADYQPAPGGVLPASHVSYAIAAGDEQQQPRGLDRLLELGYSMDELRSFEAQQLRTPVMQPSSYSGQNGPTSLDRAHPTHAHSLEVELAEELASIVDDEAALRQLADYQEGEERAAAEYEFLGERESIAFADEMARNRAERIGGPVVSAAAGPARSTAFGSPERHDEDDDDLDDDEFIRSGGRTVLGQKFDWTEAQPDGMNSSSLFAAHQLPHQQLQDQYRTGTNTRHEDPPQRQQVTSSMSLYDLPDDHYAAPERPAVPPPSVSTYSSSNLFAKYDQPQLRPQAVEEPKTYPAQGDVANAAIAGRRSPRELPLASALRFEAQREQNERNRVRLLSDKEAFEALYRIQLEGMRHQQLPAFLDEVLGKPDAQEGDATTLAAVIGRDAEAALQRLAQFRVAIEPLSSSPSPLRSGSSRQASVGSSSLYSAMRDLAPDVALRISMDETDDRRWIQRCEVTDRMNFPAFPAKVGFGASVRAGPSTGISNQQQVSNRRSEKEINSDAAMLRHAGHDPVVNSLPLTGGFAVPSRREESMLSGDQQQRLAQYRIDAMMAQLFEQDVQRLYQAAVDAKLLESANQSLVALNMYQQFSENMPRAPSTPNQQHIRRSASRGSTEDNLGNFSSARASVPSTTDAVEEDYMSEEGASYSKKVGMIHKLLATPTASAETRGESTKRVTPADSIPARTNSGLRSAQRSSQVKSPHEHVREAAVQCSVANSAEFPSSIRNARAPTMADAAVDVGPSGGGVPLIPRHVMYRMWRCVSTPSIPADLRSPIAGSAVVRNSSSLSHADMHADLNGAWRQGPVTPQAGRFQVGSESPYPSGSAALYNTNIAQSALDYDHYASLGSSKRKQNQTATPTRTATTTPVGHSNRAEAVSSARKVKRAFLQWDTQRSGNVLVSHSGTMVMGNASRAMKALLADGVVDTSKVSIPMFALGTVGISSGEFIFECRYERKNPRNARPFAIGVTSKYFQGPQRRCPAFAYRSDGTIATSSDDAHGVRFGPPLAAMTTVTVHLNLSKRVLVFSIDGVNIGPAFEFQPVSDPEPLFPLVVFAEEGDSCCIQPPHDAASAMIGRRW